MIRTNELALERACSEVECSIQEAKAFAMHLNAIDRVNDFLDHAWPPNEDVTRLQATVANLPEFRDTYGLYSGILFIPQPAGTLRTIGTRM